MSTLKGDTTMAKVARRQTILESKLRQLLGDSLEREDLQVEDLPDAVDRIISRTARELAVERVNRQAHLIQEIQSALSRIEDGSYAVCEHCEKVIPQKRLKALPWARLCFPCQSEEEVVKRFQNAA